MTDNETISGDLWQSKPWWCQPWTIILTGVVLVAGSWLVLHLWWLTVPLAILIGVWWWYFLVLVPKMLQQMALTAADPGKQE
jgi:Flp pilus assembly protein TadB